MTGAKLALRPSLYWQRYCTTFEQWASAKLSGVGSVGEFGAPQLISMGFASSSSGYQPNFAAWDKEIRQGDHHVVLPCHIINFSYYLDRLSQRMAEKA